MVRVDYRRYTAVVIRSEGDVGRHSCCVVFNELAADDIFIREMVNPSCPNSSDLWTNLKAIICTFHVFAGNERCVSNYGWWVRQSVTFHQASNLRAYREAGRLASAFLRMNKDMISLQGQVRVFTVYVPRSKDCFAIPREASLPAKFPYIPSVTKPMSSK